MDHSSLNTLLNQVSRFIFLFLFLFTSARTLFGQDSIPGHPDSEALIEKGIGLQDEGKFSEALACFARVSKCDPNYPWSVYESALALYSDDKPEEALKKCDEAFFLNYRIPQLYSMKGSILDNMGKHTEGAAVLDSALKMWPYNQNLLFNLSVCLANMNEMEAAEKVLLKSIRINPYHKGSHLALAKINLYMGRTGQAYLAFNMAILLSPSVNYISQYENAIMGKYDTLIHPSRYHYHADPDSAKWKDLAMMLNSGIPLSNDFEYRYKPDFKVTRMSLALFTSVSYLKNDTSLYNQLYVRFFSEMIKGPGFEVFLNHIMQNSGKDQPKEWLASHKEQYDKFVNWAKKSLNDGRETGFSYPDEIAGLTRYHYDDKGIFQAIGTLNTHTGKKTGDWITLNDKGGVEESGNYTDGKKTGPWSVYWQTATIKQKLFFTLDSLDGTCYSYYQNGVKSGTYHFIMGKEDGREEHYSSSGGLNRYTTLSMDSLEGPAMVRDLDNWLERNYSNKSNKINGELKETWLNGARKYSCNYKDGLRNGIVKTWYPNDSLDVVANYVNDTLRGNFTEYYRNGRVWKETVYDDKGRVQGIVRTYTRDGKIFSVDSSYTADIFTGNHTEFYKSGIIKEILNKKDNIPVWVKSYDSTGRMIYGAEAVNGILRYKNFYPDGRLMTEGDLDKGQRKGEWILYGPSGLKQKSATYLNDMLSGPQSSYYKTGALKDQYKNDSSRIVGPYTEYYKDGKVKTKGYYSPSSASGDWITYYPDDSVESESFLVNGHPAGRTINRSLSNKIENEVFCEEDGTETRTIFYDRAGNISSDYKYAFGESKGIDRFPDGTVHYVLNMSDHYRNGNFEIYYPNGKLLYQVPYNAGRVNGMVKTWERQGDLLNETPYLMGSRNGIQTLYSNGIVVGTDLWEDNNKEGTGKDYDETGKLSKVIAWSDDVREGNSDYYAPDGRLMYRVIYWSDVIAGYTCQGPDGKLLPVTPVTGETTEMSATYSDGKPSMKAGLKSGNYNGKFTSWYHDGSVMKEVTYIEDEEEGVYRTWNEAKNPVEMITYKGGYRNGPYCSYYPNGNIRFRGQHYFNMEDGDWEMFDETGKKIALYKYDRGNLYEIKTF